jgi:hypothetical protein
VVSPDPLSPAANFFTYEESMKHRRGHWYPKPADEGHIQMEYSYD